MANNINTTNVWFDTSPIKILSEDIIKMMPTDPEDPIRQILYFGNKEKFEEFKRWHGIDKTGVYTRFMPFDAKEIEATYLYGFNYTIMVIPDDITINITEQDIRVYNTTHSQMMKEIEFPTKWFSNKLERMKKKKDSGFKSRYELLDL